MVLDPAYEPAVYNRMIVEGMDEAESLRPNVKEVDCYRDYRGQGASSVEEMLEEVQERATV